MTTRIVLSGARAAFIGPSLNLSPHRNAAATVAISIDRPFALQVGADGYVERDIALIPPGRRHHLVASGRMAFLYLDALSDDVAVLQGADLSAAAERARGALRRSAGVQTLCEALGVPARRADARIVRALALLEEDPEAFGRLADAARAAGLSASRFAELSREAVGAPFRRYRLWRRMAAVMRALGAGETLTQAAFGAGFSSSPHLSTTFRDMFGVSPSGLLKLRPRIEEEFTAPSSSGQERASARAASARVTTHAPLSPR
jgi:AraC-like DNA-binding protein